MLGIVVTAVLLHHKHQYLETESITSEYEEVSLPKLSPQLLVLTAEIDRSDSTRPITSTNNESGSFCNSLIYDTMSTGLYLTRGC